MKGHSMAGGKPTKPENLQDRITLHHVSTRAIESKFFRGGYIGDYMGEYHIGVMKGDIRSLDCSPYNPLYNPSFHFIFHFFAV